MSSFDKGQGMVNILNETPIDYVIWGNHEHDLGLYKEKDNPEPVNIPENS